jgi:hypothetical protein
MTHLTTDELLACREPGLEPGVAQARAHLEGCAECRAELDRLDQVKAQLRALPTLRPARDHWDAVRTRVRAERRQRIMTRAVAGTIAFAAGVALMLMVRTRAMEDAGQEMAITEAMHRSSQLEQVLQQYNPDERVVDGRSQLVAGQLEDRIAVVDRELERAQLLEAREREQELLRLWRQRVGLLDALVDVHLTRAQAVGF